MLHMFAVVVKRRYYYNCLLARDSDADAVHVLYSMSKLPHLPRGSPSLPVVSHGQLRCRDFAAFGFDFLYGLLLLVVDDSLLLEVFDLSAQSAGRARSRGMMSAPSCVRSSSQTPGRPAHTPWPPRLCPFWNSRYRGCCYGRDIRRRHRETRSTSAASISSGPRTRRRPSSWGPSRPRKRSRTNPLCYGRRLYRAFSKTYVRVASGQEGGGA